HLHLFQPGFDGGVEHLVTDHHANATDQIGLQLDLQVELATKALFKHAGQISQPGSVDVERTEHGRVKSPQLGVLEHPELFGDFGQHSQAAVVDDGAQKVLRHRGQSTLEHTRDNAIHLIGGDVGVVSELAQL